MQEAQGYPLEQIALIKQKKLDEAEKTLREKKQALEREQEKLAEVEKERDEVKGHRLDKLTQLRSKMDEGAPSDKIQQMRYYLKVVDEKLKVKENKVKDQLKQVENAKQQVETARSDLIKKQQAVEKMQLHRKEWEQEMKALAEHKEGLESDEMGSTIHQRKKRSDTQTKKGEPS
jgi:flagellar biosynthesis chaperone FliJ